MSHLTASPPPPAYIPDSYKHILHDPRPTRPTLASITSQQDDLDAEGSIELSNDDGPLSGLVDDQSSSPASSPEKLTIRRSNKTRRIAIASSDDDEPVQLLPPRKTLAVESDSDDDIVVVGPSRPRKRLLPFATLDRPDDDPDITIVSGPKRKARASTSPKKASKKRKPRAAESEDDAGSDDDWKQARSDVDEDEGGWTISEEEALKFLNTCDVTDLPAVTACSLDQAKTIVSFRPFANVDDLKKKLRKQKGVSSAVLDQYRDVMKGYLEVDRVLSRCEQHGEELSAIMEIWAGKETNGDAVELVELSTNAKTSHAEAFANFIHTQPATVPKGIELKTYQLLGINWLNLLYSKRISCILADEMGLGKTAQVVCFLSHLKATGARGPHLVIVPSSTLDNWLREFGTFSTNLEVRAYYGSQLERADLRYELKALEELDVVITTYNVATGAADDRKFLDRMRFQSCVYDEGHQLKNSESKRYKDLMRQKVRWRLLLTGTPLQNNLHELVSLLSFILPKIFENAKDDLRTIFKVPSEAQANLLAHTRIMRAKKMMAPFVLRRRKVHVLKELPRKIERVMYCEMEEGQREIYMEVMRRSKKHLMALQDGGEVESSEDDSKYNGLLGGGRKLSGSKGPKKTLNACTNNVVMELRKAANHPMLFRRQFDDQTISRMSKACLKELEFCNRDQELILEDMEVMNDFELQVLANQYKHLNQFALPLSHYMTSGKVQMLKDLVLKLKPTGSRILIFSQFTQMLAILEKMLDMIGVRYLILTGQTVVGERQPLVDLFTRDKEITVFLLSTRAGGLGLNLMAADTVIIFDQDFNPHNDRQAEDRAYRLGQTRDVRVYKFVTRNTIEEDILQLASTKIAIDTSISSSTASETNTNPGGSHHHQSGVTSIEDGISSGSLGDGVPEVVVKNKLMDSLRKRMMEEE